MFVLVNSRLFMFATDGIQSYLRSTTRKQLEMQNMDNETSVIDHHHGLRP